MTNKEYIQELLIREPEARERKKRTEYIVDKLIKERFFTLEKVHRRSLVEICKECESLIRAWRDFLEEEENAEYRGSDFWEGKVLSQKKQIELGYEVGYNEDIKLHEKV